MKHSSYSVGQIALHWVSAVVILWALLSGFYIALFAVESSTKEWIGFFNVSLTALYIPIFVLRLYYSFFYDFPLFARKRSLAEYMALFVHKVIYLTVAIVLLTGVLMMDRPINIFGVLFIPQPITDPTALAWYMRVHIQACVVLLILVALHIGAVIRHELFGHRVLRNMSFRASSCK